MQAGTPAVLVPFDDGAEVEQTLRARSLAQMPAIEVMRSAEMTPRGLCDAVERVMMDGRRADTGLGFDGADQSVTLAVEMARARR
jgi:predicted glycosyltransferase